MHKDFTSINYRNFIKFVLPTIFSMMFISIYTMTDGIFVANRLGDTALAALNIAMPAFNFIFGSIFMVVVGSSAVIGINLGAKEFDKANKNFANMTYLLGGLVVIYLVVGLLFSENIARLLGAEDELLAYATDYLFILFVCAIGFVLKLFAEVFLRLEGKFNLSLIATVTGGILNIILDYLFMYQFDMGIKGAALGTIIGAFVNGLFGLLFFMSKKCNIKFRWARYNGNFVKESLLNGSSEMVSSISAGITTFLFNMVLLKQVGKTGVSSISILLYINFLLSSIFIGISMGIQPLLSYNYGAKEKDNIKKLVKMSCIIIGCISIFAFAGCNLFKYNLIALFTKEQNNLVEMTANAFSLFSFTFFVNGFNILGSAYFTALGNGKYSAIISFARSMIFKCVLILTLPLVLGLTGVWITIPISEYLCLIITIYFYRKCNKKVIECDPSYAG